MPVAAAAAHDLAIHKGWQGAVTGALGAAGGYEKLGAALEFLVSECGLLRLCVQP